MVIDCNDREVRFDLYCPKCKYEQNSEMENPCHDCLENPVNDGTDKPVEFHEKTKSKGAKQYSPAVK